MTVPSPTPSRVPLPVPPPPVPWRDRVGDDWAYMLPMVVFLGFVAVGGQWPDLYVPAYVARTVLAAATLAAFRPRYTRVRWTHLGLGLLVGVLGIFQWVGMQAGLEHLSAHFRPAGEVFDPLVHFPNGPARWAFYAVRLTGAVLVVPVVEELFWRDWLWRTVLAPNNFKLAAVGEWAVAPLLVTTAAFATVHGNWWPTAVVWGLMVAALLVYTKSLGACIVAHATTNLLLGVYVLAYQKWSLW